eukprot:TRINITY_DN4105_c0_g1_i1.p2 TRINITY_DN4105_c0_g1~~TRINITY_DN4105_c0_g1_i1.p2  ORF type:complete len:120 (+),score=5.75 TRINITY_DN4105_c0_g1_i1:333-692(+)
MLAAADPIHTRTESYEHSFSRRVQQGSSITCDHSSFALCTEHDAYSMTPVEQACGLGSSPIQGYHPCWSESRHQPKPNKHMYHEKQTKPSNPLNSYPITKPNHSSLKKKKKKKKKNTSR